MGAGQQRDGAHERPNGLGVASVGTLAGENHLADQLFFDDRNGQGDVERIVRGLAGLGVEGAEFRLNLAGDGVNGGPIWWNTTVTPADLEKKKGGGGSKKRAAEDDEIDEEVKKRLAALQGSVHAGLD